MGILDDLKNTASSLPGVSKVVNSVEPVANAVFPQALSNLQAAHGEIAQKINDLGQELSQNPGVTSNFGDITQLRTLLMNHYTNLQAGGEPAPDPITKVRIKAMPQYPVVMSGYDDLNQKLASIEKTYQGCTFGYQLTDGSIAVPSSSWMEEQWQQTVTQSKDQTPRCWLDSDRTQYI
jgi:hypothetical protein